MFDEQLSKIPTEPPRSPRVLPGLMIRRAIFHRGWMVSVMFLALFGLFPALALFSEPAGRLLWEHSKTATGTVIQVAVDRRTRHVEITYKFRTDETQEYRATRDVSVDSPYAAIQPGESVPVKFLVADPSVNRIVDDRPFGPDPLAFVMILGFFIALLVGPIFIPTVVQVLRDRKVFCKGKLADAVVVFVQPTGVFAWFGWSGLYRANVYLTFQLNPGGHAEARTIYRNEWLLKNLAPGTSVHIAYLPKRPSRAVLLEAYIR